MKFTSSSIVVLAMSLGVFAAPHPFQRRQIDGISKATADDITACLDDVQGCTSDIARLSNLVIQCFPANNPACLDLTQQSDVAALIEKGSLTPNTAAIEECAADAKLCGDGFGANPKGFDVAQQAAGSCCLAGGNKCDASPLCADMLKTLQEDTITFDGLLIPKGLELFPGFKGNGVTKPLFVSN